jgi:hypothetical protein
MKIVKRLCDALASCIEAIDEDNRECNINLGDPLAYKADMQTKHTKAWQDAVDVELVTLRNNCARITIQKPSSVLPLHTKWVFKTKLDAYGGIECFKARQVACGNEQKLASTITTPLRVCSTWPQHA